MIMNNELERYRLKFIVAYFKILLAFLGGSEEKYKKLTQGNFQVSHPHCAVYIHKDR